MFDDPIAAALVANAILTFTVLVVLVVVSHLAAFSLGGE